MGVHTPSESHSTYWFLKQHGLHQTPKIMFQIKRRQNFINRRARGRPCGINPSTRTPSTMDEDRLVLRASQRPTRASILVSLGARIGVRDSSATSSTHRAAVFDALSAPKRIACVHYTFECCVYCRLACVAGILHPTVRLSPPLSAPPCSYACCRRPPLPYPRLPIIPSRPPSS